MLTIKETFASARITSTCSGLRSTPDQPQTLSQSSQQHYVDESSPPLRRQAYPPVTHWQQGTTAPTTFGHVEVKNDKGKGKAKHKKLPLYQDRPAMCEILGVHPKAKLAMSGYLRFVQRACLEHGLHLEDRWTSCDEDKAIRPTSNTAESHEGTFWH